MTDTQNELQVCNDCSHLKNDHNLIGTIYRCEVCGCVVRGDIAEFVTPVDTNSSNSESRLAKALNEILPAIWNAGHKYGRLIRNIDGTPKQIVDAKSYIVDLHHQQLEANIAEARSDELTLLDTSIERRPDKSSSPNGGDIQRYCDARKEQIQGRAAYDPRMYLGYPAQLTSNKETK